VKFNIADLDENLRRKSELFKIGQKYRELYMKA